MDPHSWLAPIDAYCERTDPSFWSEPVNAVSNAAFLIAAGAAALLLRRQRRADAAAVWLIAVAALVGVGSFLFHTFANRWSLLADVLPIAVFIYGYFLLSMRRYLGLGIAAALGATLAFAAFNMSFVKLWKAMFGQAAVDMTNGSVGYFPAALALFAVGSLEHYARPTLRAEAEALVLAGAVFCASLVFRTLDPALCGALAVGSHFLWHALNGAVLYILMRAAILWRGERNQGPIRSEPRRHPHVGDEGS
jgi:hypothetical protein